MTPPKRSSRRFQRSYVAVHGSAVYWYC